MAGGIKFETLSEELGPAVAALAGDKAGGLESQGLRVTTEPNMNTSALLRRLSKAPEGSSKAQAMEERGLVSFLGSETQDGRRVKARSLNAGFERTSASSSRRV